MAVHHTAFRTTHESSIACRTQKPPYERLAAHRMRDDGDAVNAKLVENRTDQSRLPLDRVVGGGRRRAAMFDQIDADRAMSIAAKLTLFVAVVSMPCAKVPA